MHVINKLIDLGYSFETFKANNMTPQNPFPKNPMLVSKIQDALFQLTLTNGVDLLTKGGIMGMAILSYHKSQPTACISAIYGEAQKNRSKVVDLIGEKTLALIEEYMNDESPEDIPTQLFTVPGSQRHSDCGNYLD